MNGLDAIIDALRDCAVRIATGVPGFPTTVLMDHIGEQIPHEWSVNEKVALEIALGSSICGDRSAVITKHVGMNILADPLVTSATHTTGAGVVIIAGDDPGPQQSQNEQDSRFFGLVAEVPVFDPKDPETAYKSIQEAFALSEHARAPAIVRITDRLLKMEGSISEADLQAPAFLSARSPDKPFPSDFDKNIWRLTMKGKHQRFHRESYPKMCEYAENSPLNVWKKGGKFGIISSGFPSALVDSIVPDHISHLSLGIVNPLCRDLVNRFLEEHERVLVVEETEPVIEQQLAKNVLGKLTGHMPYGAVETEHIQRAVEHMDKDRVVMDIIPQSTVSRAARHPCDGCPYLPLYTAIKELDVPVAGDMGCSILTSVPPFCLIDAAFALGSSIGTASGFNRKGIAIVGDFALAHSGISGLINAIHNNHEVVVVVLQNDVSAMTGGQKVPDLTEVVRSCVQDTEIIKPQEEMDIKHMLEEKLKRRGISVILARARCPKFSA